MYFLSFVFEITAIEVGQDLIHSNFLGGTLPNKSVSDSSLTVKCVLTLAFCVPCPFKHSMHHSLSFICLQSFHCANGTVSVHMISTDDSELVKTCTGIERKKVTLVFVFDVFHKDFMTK